MTGLSEVVLSLQNINLENEFLIYPNPIENGEILTISGKNIKSYSIISTFGQVVQQGTLVTNDLHTVQLDNCATGMYLLYLKTANGIMTRKLIVK